MINYWVNLNGENLNAHIVDGEPVKGTEIGIKLIRLLLKMRLYYGISEYEAMGVPRVRTERSVAYIDHNTLQMV